MIDTLPIPQKSNYSMGLSSILIWVKLGDFIPTQFKKPTKEWIDLSQK
jgi:hypothetical protein